ncbi:hypothetical protein JHK87_000215 [Glycine soja]|nr:hypothetical protein JHK87_000215 [Glycine soja]
MNNSTTASVTHVLNNKRDFPSVNDVANLLILSIENRARSSHLVNGLKNAFERNVNHRRRRALAGVVHSLRLSFVFDGQDEEILHTVHRQKIALVVEDVHDGSCYQIVYHQAAVDEGTQGFFVDGEVEGSEEAKGRRRCKVRF